MRVFCFFFIAGGGMGFLSDAAQQDALFKAVVRRELFFRMLLVAAGVTGICLLGHRAAAQRTGPHENAMAPGQVDTVSTAKDYAAVGALASGANRAAYLEGIAASRAVLPTDKPRVYGEWFEEQLAAAGLSVHRQHYQVADPLSGRIHNRTSVYGIFRAPRSDQTECLVLHASAASAPSAGLALGLGSFFAGMVVWARNIIILLTPDEDGAGVDAFLSAYNFAPHPSGISYQSLPARAGEIHSAVSLAMDLGRFDFLLLGIHGTNGRMTNYDLVTASRAVARKANTKLKLDGAERQIKPVEDFGLTNLGGLLTASFRTASCRPDGAHAVFLRHGIEAVTLKTGHNDVAAGVRAHGGKYSVGREGLLVTEGLFRVLNNLSQKFNQCFYFYLIVNFVNAEFVPLGTYMIPVALLLGSLLLGSACRWFYAGRFVRNAETDAEGCGPDPSSHRVKIRGQLEQPKQLERLRERIVGPAAMVVLATYVAAAGCVRASDWIGPALWDVVADARLALCGKYVRSTPGSMCQPFWSVSRVAVYILLPFRRCSVVTRRHWSRGLCVSVLRWCAGLIGPTLVLFSQNFT